jgi:chaperonin GroES
MKLQPLSNHVLVEAAVDEAKVTKSGIVLPDTADKKKQVQGTVVAVGPGKLNEKGERLPLSVKVGDKVLFKEPWSDDHKFEEENNKKFFLVDEDDILGIIG